MRISRQSIEKVLYRRLIRIMLRILTLVVILLLPLCSLSSLSEAKVTGEEIYNKTLESTQIYNDTQLQEYIRNLGEEIVAVSEMPNEKFIFTLLDSPDLNAFATRDNYVYVNRGLLNYVSNEAQLVSVLAHEVAHITRNHVLGQEEKATGAKIISTIAGALSGSSEVYEASMAYANSLIKGRGRKNELEADETGAEYMAKLGYEPTEMLSMLSIMKDYESYQKKQATSRGVTRPTYHGVFASHPRNDSRLRTVVVKANQLKSSETRDDGAERYRRMTDGLVWGENFLAKVAPPERFSDMKLRIRIDFPKDWTHLEEKSKSLVTGSPNDQSASLSMQGFRRTIQTPEEYLYNYLNVPLLENGKSISPSGLSGYTGLLANEDGSKSRIAVIYYKLNAFLFRGEVEDMKEFESVDDLFTSSIATFRPISSAEIAGQKPKVTKYVKIDSPKTYEELAKAEGLNAKDIDTLRIINGHYPSGEPRSGQWIKIFKQ